MSDPPWQNVAMISSDKGAAGLVRQEIPILRIRGRSVLIDADLARLYGVPTRVLNQAIRRNSDRFPGDFQFRLSEEEKREVITNCDHLRALKFSATLPLAFTEHGTLMAANVLNNPQAIQMSLFIVRAFVQQRETLATHISIQKRLAEIDRTLLIHDAAVRDLYRKLRPLLLAGLVPSGKEIGPRKEIGFHTLRKQSER